MQTPIRIVYFYTAVVHYVFAVLKAIKKIDPSIEITLVYYDKNDITKGEFRIPNIDGIKIIPRSSLNKHDLFELLIKENPKILYISGWVDKEYLWAAKKIKQKKTGIQVVTGIDDQWFGTLRQHLGVYYYKLFYSKIFDFFWVAGKPQYHYAQRFGLKNERIISNLLTADTDIFSGKCKVTKRFVFIGRFVDVKGLDILIQAYNQLPEAVKTSWPLVLIGNGPLKVEVETYKNPHISILPFMQPDELKMELSKGGVLCMPSKSDAWGVAIHELALNGYPLILSTACGAATEFLISGYNGYLFLSGSVDSLKEKLIKISKLSDDMLDLYSERSVKLGNRINPDISAQSLLSIIELSSSL
jgi:glycosyltransferase involved in cell wall biosynthesis